MNVHPPVCYISGAQRFRNHKLQLIHALACGYASVYGNTTSRRSHFRLLSFQLSPMHSRNFQRSSRRGQTEVKLHSWPFQYPRREKQGGSIFCLVCLRHPGYSLICSFVCLSSDSSFMFMCGMYGRVEVRAESEAPILNFDIYECVRADDSYLVLADQISCNLHCMRVIIFNIRIATQAFVFYYFTLLRPVGILETRNAFFTTRAMRITPRITWLHGIVPGLPMTMRYVLRLRIAEGQLLQCFHRSSVQSVHVTR